MKRVTCEKYLANEALREQLEREARRARSEAVQVRIGGLLKSLFSRASARQMSQLKPA